jgi:hypothetical protein
LTASRWSAGATQPSATATAENGLMPPLRPVAASALLLVEALDDISRRLLDETPELEPV